MNEWIMCPYCGTMMTTYTNFRQCSLCGYRIPPQTVTLSTGTAKPKNIAEGKKAYTADTSVLKVSVDAVPVIRCKDCKYWSKPYGWNGFCDQHGIPAEADDFCSQAKRKEE